MRSRTGAKRGGSSDHAGSRSSGSSTVRRRSLQGNASLPMTTQDTKWRKRRKVRRYPVFQREIVKLFRKLQSVAGSDSRVARALLVCSALSVVGWILWRMETTVSDTTVDVDWSLYVFASRPLTATALPIIISSVVSAGESSPSFRYPHALSAEAEKEGWYIDYGDLRGLRLLEEDGARRVIYHNWKDERGTSWDEAQERKGRNGAKKYVKAPRGTDDDYDQYYNFDDDAKRNVYVQYDDDEIQNEKRCRRTSWHRLQFPNCNAFHEMDSVTNFPRYLDYGAYRQVFAVDAMNVDNKAETIIWKEIRYWSKFAYDDFEFVRMDALVSERLSSNPRITDIYGFCGMSLFTEYFPGGDLEEAMIPTSGYIKQSDLHDEVDVRPQNKIPVKVKLGIALEMAKAIAVIHGYPGGIIVHNDIQPSQFLYTKDGDIKLNDFNRAEPMLWDEENQEYCRYHNGPGQGNYRAPEEYPDKPLNEKIDIWSYGNNLYALLTGLWIFYHLEHDKDMKQKVIKGETAFIDKRYSTRSFEEGKLVEVIKRCWAYDPDDRPSIFEIVNYLSEAMDESLRPDKRKGRLK